MRILYLSLSYIPSRRASSVQVMKTCAAFARRGHDVVLVGKAGDVACDDVHDFYQVERSFDVRTVRRPSRRGGGLAYVAGMAREMLAQRRSADVVYCRDPIGASLTTRLGLPMVFEAHEVPGERWLRRVLAGALRRAHGLVTISDALRRDLVTEGLQPPAGRVVVAPDAYDPPWREVRAHALHTPPVIGYVGSLYPGRGIETIIALARVMPTCVFRVVGGSDEDVARWRATGLPGNLELLGFRPQSELRAFYEGFDIVVMPHATTGVLGATKTSDISRWTSPMKMFEYMASGVPLVASSLPVLREVLRDGENAIIVDGDLDAWRAGLERLLADASLRSRIARTAQDDIRRSYTWDARAANVLRGLDLETVS